MATVCPAKVKSLACKVVQSTHSEGKVKVRSIRTVRRVGIQNSRWHLVSDENQRASFKGKRKAIRAAIKIDT